MTAGPGGAAHGASAGAPHGAGQLEGARAPSPTTLENRLAAKKSKSRAGKRAAARPNARRPAVAPAAPARLARVARGRKPQYFADPATDKLLWMTVTLMEELSVTRERLDTVERLLDRKKLVRIREIEGYAPDAKAEGEREARRAEYVDRVLRIVQVELDEIEGTRRDSEALEAVTS